MNRFFTINFGRTGMFLFGLLLFYLAGVYLGSFYLYLFNAGILVLIISFIQIIWSFFYLRIYETFSTQHPIKGETIKYHITLSNEFILPSCRLELKFMAVQPGLSVNMPDISLNLLGGEIHHEKLKIECPFRGVYTVGIKSLSLHDMLGLFSVKKNVVFNTFYVLPRIVEIAKPFKSTFSQYVSAKESSHGAEEDSSLFEGYKVYRQGESIRHISWKKFFASGIPFLKEFGKTSEPGIQIYLDLRRTAVPSLKVLEMEDCSIEILVALVKYYLDIHVPVTVHAMIRDKWTFYGDKPEHFNDFHESTARLKFQNTLSPLSLFYSDTNVVNEYEGTFVFITHINDEEIIDIVEKFSNSRNYLAAIVNQSGFSKDLQKSSSNYYESVKERGGKLITIKNADSILEELHI